MKNKKIKKLTIAHKENISRGMTGRILTNKTKKKISKKLKGKHVSPSTEFKKGITTGKNHPCWKGGKSFEVYPKEFKEIRYFIRFRDNLTCQECGNTEKELKKKLDIHHIDYNKKNNKPKNLISLCRKCHAKTNYQRKDWKNYFKKRRLVKQ